MRRFSGFRAALLGGSLCTTLCLLTTSAFGQVNGLFGAEIQTAADPSTSNVTNTYNGIVGGASVNDSAATGTGDDRYDLLLSTNHGSSAATFPITQSFFISADVTLSGTSLTPRKEAGIRVNGTGSNLGNDAQFILDTDAGEIVAFGGNAPFALFGNNSHGTNNVSANDTTGNPFVNGQTIYMAESYNATAGTITYFAQDLTTGSPLYSSGPNNAYTPVGPYQVGFYNQFTPSGAADSDSAVFTNITATVPEPASFCALVLGGSALLARRRSIRVSR